MRNQVSNKNEKCCQCSHLGYCQIYWGPLCKRQGGNKIPRLISRKQLNFLMNEADVVKCKSYRNPFLKTKIETSQPIKTRRVDWG